MDARLPGGIGNGLQQGESGIIQPVLAGIEGRSHAG
jgi:hypothetical protein